MVKMQLDLPKRPPGTTTYLKSKEEPHEGKITMFSPWLTIEGSSSKYKKKKTNSNLLCNSYENKPSACWKDPSFQCSLLAAERSLSIFLTLQDSPIHYINTSSSREKVDWVLSF